MDPGAIPFTLIPWGPSSTARCLVIASTPALAAPACVCKAVPQRCNNAVMFIMIPPFYPVEVGSAEKHLL